jgi:hypothetical protein
VRAAKQPAGRYTRCDMRSDMPSVS